MMYPVVLCIDADSANKPALLGIKGADLQSQEWLKVFSDAYEVRKYLQHDHQTHEVWVINSDNIEAINLAAALKQDRTDCVVCLISFDLTGSLKSRAKAAGVDAVLNQDAFLERFNAVQRKTQGADRQTLDSGLKLQDNIKNNVNRLTENRFQSVSGSSSPEGKKAFILPVVSASGGAGKSSVAAICSVLSCASGHKTLLVDADMQFGDMTDMMGANQAISLDEIITDSGAINQLQQKGIMPALLACPSKPELAETVLREFPVLLDALADRFDVIVVNSGSFWGEQQAVLLEKCSKALFLIDQRPSSINATKKAIELCERCGIATGSITFAINKCKKNSLYTSIDVSCALQGAGVVEIKDGGIEVDECLANGQPVALIQEKNDLPLSLWGILEEILPKSKLSEKLEQEASAKSKGKKQGLFFRRKRA